MRLKPSPISQIPEGTSRIAKAAFPKGNRHMPLRDTFGDFFNATDGLVNSQAHLLDLINQSTSSSFSSVSS